MPFYAVGCCRGLETSTKVELTTLGYLDVKVRDGFVTFSSKGELHDKEVRLIRTAEWISKIDGEIDDPEGLAGGEAHHVFQRASLMKGRAKWSNLSLRAYRRYNHPSALLPSTAASVLLLINMGVDLIDPFVGGGTIVIEDRLYLRNHERYRNLGLKDHRTQGVDINKKHLSGAIKNAKYAGVESEIELLVGDATRYVPDQRFGRMITNPPFGVRGAKKMRILALYERFVVNLERLLDHPGEGVVVTTEWREMIGYLEERGYRVRNTLRFRHRKLWLGAVCFDS
jgi:23S rRNA G2445 N2-methylase RlmL